MTKGIQTRIKYGIVLLWIGNACFFFQNSDIYTSSSSSWSSSSSTTITTANSKLGVGIVSAFMTQSYTKNHKISRGQMIRHSKKSQSQNENENKNCGLFLPLLGNKSTYSQQSLSSTSLSLLPKQSHHDEKQKKQHKQHLSMSKEPSPQQKNRTEIRYNIQNRDLSNKESKLFNSFLLPIAKTLDDLSGGWALSYADLRPETPETFGGKAFLYTNFGYAIVGILLSLHNELVLGGCTEVAGVVSYWYHYNQLKYPGDCAEVRFALLVDYFTAGISLVVAGWYLIQVGDWSVIPVNILGVAGLSVFCLGLGWVWEYGVPYLITHSLWHLLGAYTGYLIGQFHLDQTASMELVSSISSGSSSSHPLLWNFQDWTLVM